MCKSEDEDFLLSRKEKKELSKKGKRKGEKPAHDREKQVHDKERPKKKDKFMKDESQSEPEEVVREKSKRKKKATHDKEVSVKGYGDRDHYSDSEVCEKVCEIVGRGSKKHSKIREVYTESESEASSDEEEIEDSSFEDDTSHKEFARRKVTKHTHIIKERYPQKEYRKDRKKKGAKPRDIPSSDEELSSKTATKCKKSKKVETETEEELSFASSSDEEEIKVHKSTKKSKHTETKSGAHTKDYEKGKTSGKKRVSLKLQSTTAEASHYPEEYKDKRRKKTVRVDEKVGKSTDSSRETYHKTRSKPPTKEAEDEEREVVKAKKGIAPPSERDLPSSEMAKTDSGDGESDESSEDENESEQNSSDEEEETENDGSSSVEEKEIKKARKSKHKASTSTTTKEMRKTKRQDDDENSKQKKSSKALLKDDSHGDKEGSDPGGSRDQPKKRNRRRQPKSTKAEATHSPEEYKDKGRKKTVRGDEKVGKSTDSSRETYHKTRSKPPRKEAEDVEREVASEKKGTAPPLERDLPFSEMAETDSGDGESDESSEDENESEQKSSDEEEETEKDDGSSVEEKEKKGSEKSTLTTTTDMQKTKSQDDDENSKQKKLSKALSKDDYKEGSDPGGSREQKDQPKKRNRRRHRESSKTPIVRGDSSPSSSQEERKKRGRDHKKKSDRKKKGKGDKDGASGTDDSSPECDMVNQSEVEKKELASVFERFYGKLCCVEFDPKIIAAQLQEKALISKVVMKEMIISPESQQAKILTLIDAVDEMIKSHPECFFPCIEVMLKNMDLQELGTRMLSEAGKKIAFCAEHCLFVIFVLFSESMS